MNVLSITAGAAGMYCGSCLRDNALAAELLRRGHQVTLLPLYTPTITDEANVSRQERVFFGGISVYLEQKLAIFRHTPWLVDRLWDAPGVIRAFASRSIQTDPRMLGALTVSMLRGESGHQHKELRKLVDWLSGQPAPDVINLPNSLLIAIAGPIRRALGRPIVVTLQGEDLFLEGLPEPYRTEAMALIRQQMTEVDLFVSVSEYYARFMAGYLGIPSDRIRTVPLGITLGDLPLASSDFSLNATQSGEEGREWVETLEDDAPQAEERVARESDLDRARTWLTEAFQALTPRERMIIAARKLAEEPETLESLGNKLKLSKERIRQLEAQALRKMRQRLESAHGPAAAALAAEI
jgi:RNA polymerase sigma factor (sigma-70 family)